MTWSPRSGFAPLHANPPLPIHGRPHALFLDFDGTLCPPADHPSRVSLPEKTRQALERLHQRSAGAVVVLSGRSQHDLDSRLHGLDVLRLGEHGRDPERPIPVEVSEQLTAVQEWWSQAQHALAPAWLERKPASCALHARGTPGLAKRLVAEVGREKNLWPALRLIEGSDGVELVGGDSHKGKALRRLMSSHAGLQGLSPVAVGDGETDEEAFEAAVSLGGWAVAVGQRPSTHARFWLPDWKAVSEWLTECAAVMACPRAHAGARLAVS